MRTDRGRESMLDFGGIPVDRLGLPYVADVDLFSGGGTIKVPIPMPQGRDGFAPDLTLAYASGAGNSPFGAGWSLSGLPSIGLDTRYHVPRWDGTDGYQFGGDELVPWLEDGGGTWERRSFPQGSFTISLFRSRRGSSKVRVEKWVDDQSGRVHFRTRDQRNKLTIYGARPNAAARIADPTDESRTFAWLPELLLDANGNAIFIEYASETADGVDFVNSFERTPPSLAQRYLKRLRYGNSIPLSPDDALLSGTVPENVTWAFQIVVDYGDHSDQNRPAAAPDRVWPVRDDPFSTYANGFEIRTYRLCRRFLSFHEFAELGSQPELTAMLGLEHDADPAGSTLAAITYTGCRVDAGTFTSASLPAIRMTYAPPIDVASASMTAVSAQAMENVPGGFATTKAQFVDLYGDGLPGIVSRGDRCWWYKQNLGGGEFGPLTAVAAGPMASAAGYQLTDIDSNGNTDLTQLFGRTAGRFELDRESGAWRSFRSFEEFPHVEALSRSTRWVDLNGDRRADLVVTHSDRFTWFASEGDGFKSPIDIPRPAGAAAIPTLSDDASLDFVFADMTGDGLPDMVRVQNGRVEYWPSLGGGKFGEAVVMEGAPQFARDDEFDASRLRFVDLDGSGTSDIVYLGNGAVSCWINASGNRLLPGPALDGLPYFDNDSNVAILDFLGDGTSCLVWSSPLPGRDSSIEYVQLVPPVRPRLLLGIDNGMGRVATFTYESSSKHFLRDAQRGRDWTTRLPGHRPVVSECSVSDAIGATSSSRRFEYHDGFYDGRERELRGFGTVDVYDSQNGATSAPPSLQRIWFHLGTPMWRTENVAAFFQGDPQLPILSGHVVDGADRLSADDIDEGMRALAGYPVRTETFAVDATGTIAPVPIEIAQQRYVLRALQPRGVGAPPAFSAYLLERATWTYEQTANDPRLLHTITVSVDEQDRPLRDVQIGYPRRSGLATDVDVQARYLIHLTQNVRAAFDTASRYESGLPVETSSYELAGMRPAASGIFTREDFLTPQLEAALAAPGRHDIAPVDNPVAGAAARRLTWEQTFYWDDARSTALPLGGVGALALLHHEEGACFETGFVNDAFGTLVDAALLATLGYTQREGFWWQSDPVLQYTTPGAFSLPAGSLRGDGAATTFEYDQYNVAVVSQTDALSNKLTAEIDYVMLCPWRVVDANGTTREVRYDPCGVVVAETVYGHVGDQSWGFDPLSAVVPRTPGNVNDALSNASTFVQGASRFVWYDLDAWTARSAPTTVVQIVREGLVNDGSGGSGSASLHVAVAYLDAFGRVLQQKSLVEDGPAIVRDGSGNVELDTSGTPVLAQAAPRWHASGHISYDAKQRPVREFQPFFSSTPDYENDAVLQTFGAATLTRYDVAGRVTGRDFPNGTIARTVYGPWSTDESDANDLVLDCAWGAARETLPSSDPERAAYDETVPHASTPSTTYFDPLGRACGRLERGGVTAGDRKFVSTRDLFGREIALVDPRGITAFTSTLDMQGAILKQVSVDAGTAWNLSDAYGRSARTWDARTFAIVRSFDLADRHIATDVTGGDGTAPLDNRVEAYTYGESLPNRGDAIANNLLGHLAIVQDSSGQTTVQSCDPAGRVLSTTRAFRTDIDAEPDWRTTVALDPETFVESATFDGLGRTVRDTLADGTTRAFAYLASGVLSSLTVTTPDGAITDAPILTELTVNARGQRLTRTYGNGVTVAYAYDPATYRTTTQTAQRNGQTFQQLAYTYDPVGNIVRIADAAQEGSGALISGVTVPAVRDNLYDAHYRLISATGRVHQALLQNDFVPGAPGTFKGTRHVTLSNGAAIERFTRTYVYDASGNVVSLKHAGTSQNWTTAMWISSTSNRSMPALDLNGTPVSDPEASFDASGNQVALAHLRSIAWDWNGRLARAVTVSRPGGTDDGESYAYGADSRRARKVATRVVGDGIVETTEYLYFRDSERKRISRNGSIILERWTDQVGDGQDRVALVDRWTVDSTQREVDAPGTRTRYHLATHQASVTIELDENASLLSYEEYFPYGGTSFMAGDDDREISAKDYRYAGKICDDATSLYYYGYRYYAPWTCRWLSCDPAGPEDDINLYQFVRGDPIGNWDADGLDSGDSKLVEYHGRDIVKPTDNSDDAAIAAARTFLGPPLQPAFDSLSRTDQLRFARDRTLALIPAQLGNPSAGWRLVSVSYFKSTYLPQAARYAKAHGHPINVTIPVDPAQKSNDDAATAPPGSAKDKDGDDASDAESTTQSPAGSDTGGDSGKKTDAAGGGGGQGTAKDNGDGSGTTGSGTGTGTTDQGDGNGNQAGTGTAANGAGGSTGATNGAAATTKLPGKTQKGTATGSGGGSGGGAGPGGGGTTAGTVGGSPSGNEFGQEGGRDDGIVGGTPFSTGDSLQALASPHANGSAGNGTATAGHANGGGRRGRVDGNIKGLGDDTAPVKGTQGGRHGGPTGNGGPPGSQKNDAGTGTAAATAHPNDNATHHGSGEGTGQQTKAETGAMATTLKIAGYLNLTFDEEGQPNGGEGGIPGGRGTHSGRFWQWLYIGFTVVETLLLVESLVKSFASGALRRFMRLFEYLASPRQILRDFSAFLREGAVAWRKFWSRAGGHGPGERFMTILKALFWDTREYASIRAWRNKSFLFKPRWLGTLERVANDSLYSWEHIIPQSLGERIPALRPFINSYLNSGLRISKVLNSALQDKLGPKLWFYSGVIAGVHLSEQFGTWIGHKLLGDDHQRSQSASSQ